MLQLVRKIFSIPFYSRVWFKALGAAEKKDWSSVVRLMEELHRRRLGTGESHHWLACAYASLERWEDAVEEFEKVEDMLSKPESEARRRYNHAYSLARLGRIDEALAVLEAGRDLGWPDPFRSRSESLLTHLRDGSLGDLRVLN